MPPRNRTLDLPVAVNESISLDLDPLPPAEDIQVFLEALVYERPPSKYWTRLASQLYIENRIPEAIQICAKGVQVLASHKPSETIPLRALLAAFSLSKARSAPKLILNDARYQPLAHQQHKEALYQESNSAQQHANLLDPKHHINQLSRAIFLTTTGQNDGALVIYDAILNQHPTHALALLGKACILLRKRQYAPALKLYQNALQVSLLVQAKANNHADIANILGWRGPDPRVGIGLCLWGLGHHDAACKAWKRAVQLNNQNSAAHLLLGITSLNLVKQTARLVPGTFGAHVERSEDEARELAYTEAMSSLQQSWKLDKSNATAAIIMCEYFINNAAQARSQPGNTLEVEQTAMAHYATALKLGEHAIQYAEARAGVDHAQLIYARASHLASQLSINATQPELRLQAQRYYAKVVESVTRILASATVANASNNAQLHLCLSLATLGLAQCQVANRDPLAAINTLDVLTSRPTSSASPTQSIELSLFAASLRAQSHPGATASERQADAERARVILDRALRLIEAAKLDAHGPQSLFAQPDEFPKASPANTSNATADAAADVPPALAKASLSIRTEDLSKTALEAIASLGSDPLTRVEFAQLLQTEDLVRASAAYAEGLELAKAKASNTGKNIDAIQDDEAAANVALLASLETCLGAVLAIRATDIASSDSQREEERNWLLQRAISRLESAVTASANAVKAFESSAPSTTTRLETQRTVNAVKLIASYNLGRANEEAGHIEVAREAYTALLGAHPEYTDAKVRLAILNVSKAPAAPLAGAEALASAKAVRDTTNTLLKQALDSDPGNLDTRSTYVCFLAGEFPGVPTSSWAAIKEFTALLFSASSDPKLAAAYGGGAAAKIAVETGRRDPHTLASLGWAYYQLAVHAAGATAKADRSKNMMRATDLMEKALSADARCAFAAQGMAILLAEDAFAETAGGSSLTLSNTLGGAPEERRRKNADEALAILSKLREVRDEASVHVCIGHVLMMKEEYERAHKSYELASKRFLNGVNAQVIQYVARAEYAIGMKGKSFGSLQSSLSHLEQARELIIKEKGLEHPECRQIEYNYAVTAQKGLQMLFDLQKDRKTAQALRDAIGAVEKVQPLLVAPVDAANAQDTPMGKEGALLEAAKRGQLLWMSADVVEQRGKYGASSLLERASAVLADQENYESEMQKQKEAVAAARREKELLREQEKIRKEEELRAQLEAMAEKRKALREEAAKIEYVRETTPEKEPRRRAKREDVTSGEEDAPDAVGEKGGKKRKRGAVGSSKKKAKGGRKKNADSDENEDESDDDDDDDEGLFGGGVSGSESSGGEDDEDGDEEIIRNGAKLLAEEGEDDVGGGSRREKSSKLSQLAQSKKKSLSSSRKSLSSKKGVEKKKKRKSLKRAKAMRDTDESENDKDDDENIALGDDDEDSEDDMGGVARKAKKGVFDESSDEDEEVVEQKKKKKKNKEKTQKRTKKAKVTNDIIDSDEEMALLDME
ncbi:related to Tetratricopeptide repeat protein 1 [Melanopsichium pennsylvanicum]|uniref:Related to Tetratricopeptide repeat protein 1 n=2 Tax=Melanopsichium pennsylvanicum TaxID=63383 RepID=A0AAJ5C8I1_9BASI|nr:related to Tetratricopeptide repeat protein 1 [Melanopsichium pennsylvanicum]